MTESKEAIFADRDGQVTACRKAQPGQSAAQIVWQKMVGDDAITKVLARDMDGDAQDEILLASKSGVIAALAGDGAVKWLRYAQNQVTDAEVAGMPGHSFILRSSTDGSIAALDAEGEEMARWTVGTPVSALEIATGRADACARGGLRKRADRDWAWTSLTSSARKKACATRAGGQAASARTVCVCRTTISRREPSRVV